MPRLLVLLPALAVLAAGCGLPSQDLASDASTYAVVEVHPVRGRLGGDVGGRVGPVRLRTLSFVPTTPRGHDLARGGVPEDPCWGCGSRPERFVVSRRLVGAYPLDDAWREGEVRRVRGISLAFRDLSDRPLLTVEGTAREPAEVEVRLVKRCRTAVFHLTAREPTSRVVGVIAVPTGAVRREWVEAAAPCFSMADYETRVPSDAERAATDSAAAE
jgi:hypothetical protein